MVYNIFYRKFKENCLFRPCLIGSKSFTQENKKMIGIKIIKSY